MKVEILEHIRGWPQPGRTIDVHPGVAAPYIKLGKLREVKQAEKRKKKKAEK